MDYRIERLNALRNILAEDEISAMIIPSSDPHFGEYIPDHYKALEWLSGFTGESATLAVTSDAAALWVDSRFFISAAKELEGSGIEMMKLRVDGTPTVAEWLKANLGEGDIVAMDENLYTYGEYAAMTDDLLPLNLTLIEDPFDAIWKDRPALQFNPIRHVGIEVCGESITSKYRRLVEQIGLTGSFTYIVTALDEIAWLCNIRGTDVEYNPLVLSYAVVTEECINLFVRQEMLPEEAVRALNRENVILKDYENFTKFLSNLPKSTIRIFSAGKISARNFFAAMDNVPQVPGYRAYIPDPVQGGALNRMKAIKNEVEVEGFRRAYVEEAKSLLKTFAWVREHAGKGITEYDVVQKLVEFRSECPEYLGESFRPIVAFGPNAALPHYAPSQNSCAEVLAEGFLLIDTGAHYTFGTTDTTRTLPLGTLTQEQKNDYTAVLKGMIDLSMAVFYKGMRGCLLDVLARGPVMKQNRMYWHGTGHGIGHNLCVHEGPQSIRMEENSVPLEAGMVMSNEPAIYVEGHYGIRHENTIRVIPHTQNEYGEFLAFETLTVIPIDMSPVNPDMLDAAEKEWIRSFNARCGKMLPQDYSDLITQPRV